MHVRSVLQSLAALAALTACADDPTAPAVDRAAGLAPRGPSLAVVAGGAYNEIFDFSEAKWTGTIAPSATNCGPDSGTPWACVPPKPWSPSDFDVAMHFRDRSAWDTPESFRAMHGVLCQPYSNAPDIGASNDDVSHLASTYRDMNYRCRNHMMTALKSSGYGVVYVTPNALVDFSSGEATVRWALSTFRSSGHDWVDVWITPWDENQALPLDGSLGNVDLQGPPRRAVHVRMTSDSRGVSAFQVFTVKNHVETQVLPANGAGYETILASSGGPTSTRRDTFELKLSRTHVKVGMWKGDHDLTHAGAVPFAGMTWVDADLPSPLDWGTGVVQFGHHSLDPAGYDGGFGGTWHWDDFKLAPAVGFTMLKATNVAPADPLNPRYADEGHPTLTLASPTPSAGYLRFAGYGEKIEVSFDDDKSRKADLQQEKLNAGDRYHSYWTPIPAGVTRITFSARKDNEKDQKSKDDGAWRVRDAAVWIR
jgi:hypothetical protein